MQEPAWTQRPGLGLVTPLLCCMPKSRRPRHVGLARSPVSHGDASGRPSSCPKPVPRGTALTLFARWPSRPPVSTLARPPSGFEGAEGREAGVRLPSKQTQVRGARAWLPSQHLRGSCCVARHQPPGGRVSPPLSPRNDVRVLHSRPSPHGCKPYMPRHCGCVV